MKVQIFQQAISHALQQLVTPSMVLKLEQRASIKRMREKMSFFGYPLDWTSQSAMKPYHLCSILSSERISPLISLMVDQVVSLRCSARGVKDAILSEHTPLNSFNIIKVNNAIFN